MSVGDQDMPAVLAEEAAGEAAMQDWAALLTGVGPRRFKRRVG